MVGALLLALPVATGGCGLQAPVLHYPWIEDHSLGLDRQQVAVTVGTKLVTVVARFEFRRTGPQRDRGLLFPIPPPCDDVVAFGARLAGLEREPESLEIWPADPELLPAGEARQLFEIVLPGRALERHDGVLIVRYQQACPSEFRYALGAGAHWQGPVTLLDVSVHDEPGRVVEARVGDRPPQVARAGRLRWTFQETEPSGALVVTLRPADRSGPALLPGVEPRAAGGQR